MSNEFGQKVILVVGDWYVEEHWVVARDRSVTASRKGESHCHVLHERGSTVQALGAAGIDASLLKAVENTKRPSQSGVYGLGAWHKRDGKQLERMLVARGFRHLNRFLETGPVKGIPKSLYNLDSLRPQLVNKLTTNRIFRVYFQDGDTTRLIQRIDWEEPPPPPGASGRGLWINEPPKTNGGNGGGEAERRDSAEESGRPETEIVLPKGLADLKLDAIVVRDHVKGVVSPALIKCLIKHCQHNKCLPEWYIYSKDWHLEGEGDKEEWQFCEHSWVRTLLEEEQNVQLFFVPRVAAQSALYEPHRHVNNWRLACRRPSWRAMKLMDALANDPQPSNEGGTLKPLSSSAGGANAGKAADALPDSSTSIRSSQSVPWVVVMPEDTLAFARTTWTQKNEYGLLIAWTDGAEPEEIGVPRGSMLFASLVAHMLQGHPEEPVALLERAVIFTDTWAKDESGRICRPRNWNPKRLKDLWSDQDIKQTKYEIDSLFWKTSEKQWMQSRRGNGVVETENPRIELWRAMTDVDGYICLAENKRRTIRSIKRQLAKFKESSDRHVSIMIEADPGSGKSSLLDKLAREADMQLMSFNITHMVSPDEILDCFDAIVSRQASSEHSKPILVFFDEINATIANDDAYGKFLDPIDRGTYRRNGRTFSISPLVWLFARTNDKKGRPRMKHSDFLSRLTLRPLDFSTAPKDKNADLERRYIGASILQTVFPEVQYACDLVLQSFDLLFDRSPRGCEKFVRQFRDIRQGQARADNVPIEWIRESWKDVFASAGEQNAGEVELEYPQNDKWEDLLDKWNEQRGKLAKPEDLLKTPFRYDWNPMLKKWKQEAERPKDIRMIKIIRRPDQLKDTLGT